MAPGRYIVQTYDTSDSAVPMVIKDPGPESQQIKDPKKKNRKHLHLRRRRLMMMKVCNVMTTTTIWAAEMILRIPVSVYRAPRVSTVMLSTVAALLMTPVSVDRAPRVSTVMLSTVAALLMTPVSVDRAPRVSTVMLIHIHSCTRTAAYTVYTILIASMYHLHLSFNL